VNLNCPKCGGALPAADVNVTTDVAVCRRCDGIFKLSELVSHEAASHADLGPPPPGAWCFEDAHGFRIGATTRSPIAFYLVPFMIVWSGFSLGGIYGHQIVQGKFQPGISLFGIPFIIGSVVFWSLALMAIAGKCELTVRGDEAALFIGLGSLGWTRRFHWSEISTVSEAPMTKRYPGNRGAALSLEGRSRLIFGSNLSDARRYYLLNALRRRLKRAPAAPGVPYRA
jgi:hypothetical protein